MESRFKVVMRKDAEVLQDFISFTYRAKGQLNRMKLRILAAGLVVIGYMAAKNDNITAGIIIGGIGILFLVISLFLPQIAVMKLKAADIAYQNQTELTYVFTNTNIYVYENGEQTQNIGGYQQVTCFYGDEKNYYLGVNNDDLYLLPRRAFEEGAEVEFVSFIERRCNEKYEFLPTTVKNKWIRYRMDSKAREEAYNAKAAKLRAEDKEKKEQKKREKQNKQ